MKTQQEIPDPLADSRCYDTEHVFWYVTLQVSALVGYTKWSFSVRRKNSNSSTYCSTQCSSGVRNLQCMVSYLQLKVCVLLFLGLLRSLCWTTLIAGDTAVLEYRATYTIGNKRSSTTNISPHIGECITTFITSASSEWILEMRRAERVFLQQKDQGALRYSRWERGRLSMRTSADDRPQVLSVDNKLLWCQWSAVSIKQKENNKFQLINKSTSVSSAIFVTY